MQWLPVQWMVDGARSPHSQLCGSVDPRLVLTCWHTAKPCTNRLEEGLQTDSHRVLIIEWAPKNACHQHYVPRRSPSKWVWPRHLSKLGLRACKILHEPFKSKVSVSNSSPVHKFCWPSKPAVLGAPLPGTGPPGWRAWCGAWTSHFLGRSSAIVFILPFVGLLLGVWILTVPHPCPSYPSLCVSFFISLVVENLFSYSLGHSHQQLLYK